jgi:ribosomal protein S14
MGLNTFIIENKKRQFYKKQELKRVVLRSLLHSNIVPKVVKKKSFYILKSLYLKNYQNFCIKSRRARGVFSYWGLSRMYLRKLVGVNFINGLRKSSW